MATDLEIIGERIAEHAAHLDAAMHRLLTDLRTFDAGGGWSAQGGNVVCALVVMADRMDPCDRA